jgi:nucleoid-associated protein YgaU
MGLFDFVSKVGAKLGIDYFEKEEQIKKQDNEIERLQQEQALREQMSKELTDKLVAMNLGIEGASVRVRARGQAHLSGTAKSQEAKEKATIFVGNHEGIAQVDDSAVTVVAPEPPGVLHRVAKGDTLSLIAKKYYGIIMAYPAIAEANTGLVKNVDAIEVDWAIRVPPLSGITHTVKAGETLGTIAQTMYGDSKLYVKIAEANKLTNPDVVSIGQVLNVPVLRSLPSPGSAGVV